jgi:lipopolysaccharide transport system permease protein
VSYKQTVLGALWAIIQPVMLMLAFTAVFGGKADMASGDLPYAVFVYAGLVAWTFVSQATGKAAMSVVSSERLVEKVYFPRLVIPISAVVGALVDFAIAAVVLGLLMISYGLRPSPAIVLLPVAILLLCVISLGFGVLFASLNITYRDFRHLMSFLLQLWMFATPSIYDQRSQAALLAGDNITNVNVENGASGQTADVTFYATEAPPWGEWFSLRDLNPLTAIITFFRATILGGLLPWYPLAKSTIFSSAILVLGLAYFRRVEDRFADII